MCFLLESVSIITYWFGALLKMSSPWTYSGLTKLTCSFGTGIPWASMFWVYQLRVLDIRDRQTLLSGIHSWIKFCVIFQEYSKYGVTNLHCIIAWCGCKRCQVNAGARPTKAKALRLKHQQIFRRTQAGTACLGLTIAPKWWSAASWRQRKAMVVIEVGQKKEIWLEQ